MPYVELRSDTFTKPTKEMLDAMYNAEVGNDGYGEDPTVRSLEELAADITGKEAGLFVTSGTQGNQIAIMVYTKRFDEVICETSAHVFGMECGGIAALSGAQPYPVTGKHGKLLPNLISEAIRPNKINAPRTALIAIENTHNHAGGTYYTEEELEALRIFADKSSLPIYMDGARIFNAAVAQGITVDRLVRYCHSMQFCLSKGLCAPVGSVLVGSREFINEARKYRRVLGGGMRQAGLLAAACIVGLNKMVDRLADDHRNARLLAEAVANAKFGIDLKTVQTNIVIFDVSCLNITAVQFIQKLRDFNIHATDSGKFKVRMVTHRDVSKTDIEYTISILNDISTGKISI